MKNIFKTLLFSLITLTIGYGQVTTSAISVINKKYPQYNVGDTF